MKWLCKIGLHKWSVKKIGMYRERTCKRCNRKQQLIYIYGHNRMLWMDN